MIYPTIAFYIHHHGSGHVTRSITIAKYLDNCTIHFLGSNLRPYSSEIPDTINCIHLPADTEPGNKHNTTDENMPDCFHYAPLGIEGVRERTKLLVDFFNDNFPLLLVVDVSVEITLLARLCGIPTIVIKQHGLRNDTAHLSAYKSAQLIIAPYPGELEKEAIGWIRKKTYYAGGFSKYSGRTIPSMPVITKRVGIITGSGGTCINADLIYFIAKSCPDWEFHILGYFDNLLNQTVYKNLLYHNYQSKPEKIIGFCEIIIGNAGHNTVMEMAEMEKKLICIPEKRPFDEQLVKAANLKKYGYAKVIMSEELYKTNWDKLLHEMQSTDYSHFKTIIKTDAVKLLAEKILSVAKAAAI